MWLELAPQICATCTSIRKLGKSGLTALYVTHAIRPFIGSAQRSFKAVAEFDADIMSLAICRRSAAWMPRRPLARRLFSSESKTDQVQFTYALANTSRVSIDESKHV